MSVTSAVDAPVFTAGGHCFTWVEVIESARARGDWAALQGHVAGLIAREGELLAAGALPTAAETRVAADEFRYQRNLLSADELQDWLARRDISVGQWMAEMRRSLLQPAEHAAAASPQDFERASWVHAVCSGKLGAVRAHAGRGGCRSPE